MAVFGVNPTSALTFSVALVPCAWRSILSGAIDRRVYKGQAQKSGTLQGWGGLILDKILVRCNQTTLRQKIC